MQSLPICAHVFVSGQVQGVAYRFSTREQALKHHLTGWVRNLEDRRVEAMFEGKSAEVEAMIQWCHQGPPAAIVQKVTVEYQDPQGFPEFEILSSKKN